MKNILLKFISQIDSVRLNLISKSFINLISRQNYAHNLDWCGTQIFQTPTDLFLYHQLIFRARPNIIIESGVAKGGSILFACQILDIIHGKSARSKWKVVCCDINSLNEAKDSIGENGYTENVIFFKGDSSDLAFHSLVLDVIKKVPNPSVFLSLDSNHTEEHVYKELTSLAPFVTLKSYVVVWDSRIGDLSTLTHYLRPRLWNKKHNAGTGVKHFMSSLGVSLGFMIDSTFEKNLKITGVKGGILQRVSVLSHTKKDSIPCD